MQADAQASVRSARSTSDRGRPCEFVRGSPCLSPPTYAPRIKLRTAPSAVLLQLSALAFAATTSVFRQRGSC
eukprot:2935818-Pleurochrysis_carterae.AAC.1